MASLRFKGIKSKMQEKQFQVDLTIKTNVFRILIALLD